MATYSSAAMGQRCGATCANAESLLGQSEQVLIATIPELQRIAKPVVGPRNTRGKWALPEIVFATQPYAVTYFIGAGQVARIELLSSASKDQCMQKVPFQTALAELGKVYGVSQASGAFERDGGSTQSAAFNTDTEDVSLHLSVSADDCVTRVIYKTRQVKDASEL
jgi:hypothetical protein